MTDDIHRRLAELEAERDHLRQRLAALEGRPAAAPVPAPAEPKRPAGCLEQGAAGCGMVVLLLAVLAGIGRCDRSREGAVEKRHGSRVYELGSEGVVARDGAFAARTSDDLDALISTLLAKDDVGVREGVLLGRWWFVGAGTAGKVIDRAFPGHTRVRFADGTAGWIVMEQFVRR